MLPCRKVYTSLDLLMVTVAEQLNQIIMLPIQAREVAEELYQASPCIRPCCMASQ
jgi:hypothetical protein